MPLVLNFFVHFVYHTDFWEVRHVCATTTSVLRPFGRTPSPVSPGYVDIARHISRDVERNSGAACRTHVPERVALVCCDCGSKEFDRALMAEGRMSPSNAPFAQLCLALLVLGAFARFCFGVACLSLCGFGFGCWSSGPCALRRRVILERVPVFVC